MTDKYRKLQKSKMVLNQCPFWATAELKKTLNFTQS